MGSANLVSVSYLYREARAVYERELNKPDVHRMKGRWNVSMDGEGGTECRHKQREGGEPTIGDEGGAQGERGGPATAWFTFDGLFYWLA